MIDDWWFVIHNLCFMIYDLLFLIPYFLFTIHHSWIVVYHASWINHNLSSIRTLNRHLSSYHNTPSSFYHLHVFHLSCSSTSIGGSGGGSYCSEWKAQRQAHAPMHRQRDTYIQEQGKETDTTSESRETHTSKRRARWSRCDSLPGQQHRRNAGASTGT